MYHYQKISASQQNIVKTISYDKGVMMRMKPEEMELLAKLLVHQWSAEKLAQFPRGEEGVLRRVVELLTQNFQQEEALNIEASRLLEQNKKKVGLNIDEDRAYQMIRKQLAKDRGFVL